MPSQLLGLLLLLHLSGMLQPRQNQPVQKSRAKAPTPTPGGPPSAQGAHGISQGFKGAQAPILGGLGSMKNTVGLYPHQMNPSPNVYSWMAGVR